MKSNTAAKSDFEDILSTSSVKFRDFREIADELTQRNSKFSTFNRKFYPGLEIRDETTNRSSSVFRKHVFKSNTFYDFDAYSDSEDPENLLNFNTSSNLVLAEYSKFVKYKNF